MKNKIRWGLIVISAALLNVNSAMALYKTFESTVEIVNPSAPMSERVIKIYSPDRVAYRIVAPDTEIERITKIVTEQPKTVLSFNGDLFDENGERVFRVQKWNTVKTTTTTTDSFGNKKVETTTETVR